MTDTVMERNCPTDALQTAVARCVREQLEVARGAYDNDPRKLEAFTRLAAYIESRDLYDQRLRALWLIQSQLGDSDSFTPGEYQSTLFARLGENPNVAPDLVLSELVAAGIEDLSLFRSAELQRLQANQSQVEIGADEFGQLRERALQLADELELARADTGTARAEADTLRAENDFLRVANGKHAGNGKQPKVKVRRRRVEGHTGIYFRDTKEGKVYEIGWTEQGSDGKPHQRWETIGPDLEEAVEARSKRTDNTTERAAA